MTDYTLTQDALANTYKQGNRFFIRIESDRAAFDFAELTVDPNGASAGELAIRWLEKHNAKSVATYRILPNGKKNLIRIYDYRDLEVA
jgi:hypothetical protein